MKANVPPKIGDIIADPEHKCFSTDNTVATVAPQTLIKPNQRQITDFFSPAIAHSSNNTPTVIQHLNDNSLVSNNIHTPPLGPTKPSGGPKKSWGFNFCNQSHCRYCPQIDKSGKIICSVTGLEHNCMKNISCRSSNLVYAITCTRCGMQYVGQTLLRLKDRFVHHYYDINLPNKEKTVSKHFSLPTHNGIKDMKINVLEFIKKPPRSPQSVAIRSRVEKNWTHLFRCMAPLGLNIDNPKEYAIKTPK
jgi:hypothetical protein